MSHKQFIKLAIYNSKFPILNFPFNWIEIRCKRLSIVKYFNVNSDGNTIMIKPAIHGCLRLLEKKAEIQVEEKRSNKSPFEPEIS